MKVLLTGGTGMVGSVVLQSCLSSPKITEVISFVRKPSGVVNEKLKEILLADFLDYSKHMELFENISVAYFCLGVYTGAVSDDLFKTITVDYTKAFANALKDKSPQSTFCLLSGAGADLKEKSRTSFARYKGMAENYLMSKDFGRFHSFRPGYIYPVEKREEPNMMYRISRSLYPVLKLFGSNMSIKSTELGEAIYQGGLEDPGKQILENRDILDFLQ